MQMKNKIASLQWILFGCLALVLAGCSSQNEFEDLKEWVKEVQQRPQGRIRPPPEFKPHATFSYSAAGLRSPFQPPVVVEESTIEVSTDVTISPDFNRVKEYLESFSFDALSLVGTINRNDGDTTLWGLVDDGSGGVHRVKEGDYLGKNHGRIINVSSVKIEVIEIVPSGQLTDTGDKLWIERPRTLVLKD